MTERFSEYNDRREWDLSGYTLDQIALDYTLRLLIASPNGSVEAVIEIPFELHRGENISRIDPELTVTTIPVLPLLHKPLARLMAFRNGVLHLHWENAAEIRVPKDDQYESWQLFGHGELKAASMLCSPHDGPPWNW